MLPTAVPDDAGTRTESRHSDNLQYTFLIMGFGAGGYERYKNSFIIHVDAGDSLRHQAQDVNVAYL